MKKVSMSMSIIYSSMCQLIHGVPEGLLLGQFSFLSYIYKSPWVNFIFKGSLTRKTFYFIDPSVAVQKEQFIYIITLTSITVVIIPNCARLWCILHHIEYSYSQQHAQLHVT